jgi:hypothetical protein
MGRTPRKMTQNEKRSQVHSASRHGVLRMSAGTVAAYSDSKWAPPRPPFRTPAAIPGQELHQRRGDHRGVRQPVLGRVRSHPASQSLRQLHRESHCPVRDLDLPVTRVIDVPAGLPHRHAEPTGEHPGRLRRSGPRRSPPRRTPPAALTRAAYSLSPTSHVINIQPNNRKCHMSSVTRCCERRGFSNRR